MWGIVLISIGALVFLSFFELAGPFGTGSSTVARLLFGMWAFVVPLALVVAGLTLIGVLGADENPKTLIGTLVLFVGSLSLFHLLTGNLPIAGTEQSVEKSGGLVGSLVAYPLERVVGYWGGFVVLVAIIGVGALLITHASLGDVLRSVGSYFSGVRGWFGTAQDHVVAAVTVATEPETVPAVAVMPAPKQSKKKKVASEPPRPDRAKPKLAEPGKTEGYELPRRPRSDRHW